MSCFSVFQKLTVYRKNQKGVALSSEKIGESFFSLKKQRRTGKSQRKFFFPNPISSTANKALQLIESRVKIGVSKNESLV
jgi:hypothetical protein